MSNDRDKMIVTDYGICIRKYIDEHIFGDSIVITKEAFIEAYNKWIKSDMRVKDELNNELNELEEGENE